MLAKLLSFLRAFNSRREFENGMAEELRFHMEEYTEDLVRSGVARKEAARRARLEFGEVNTVKEECREARGLQWPDELHRQLRYCFRLLRKTPGFTATALLTLAVCLGANLTIFAVIDSILLRPLPFAQAGRLVTIFNTYPRAGVERDGSSITNYYERRGNIPAFESVAMYRESTAILGDPGSTIREQTMNVSPEFFSTLGVNLAMGRAFRDAETTFQTDAVAILSQPYWQRHFNADPAVIGRQIRVDGQTRTVVGVLPPGFSFLSSRARVYFPLASRLEDRAAAQRHSGGNTRQMIARLKENATLQQAQAQIDAQNALLERDDPQGKMMAEAGFRSLVVSLHADHVAEVRPTLLLLQAGALALLMIGVVNLVNLLLVRANGRSKEFAVREALGAGRRHVVTEVLVETTLLSLAGGLLGIAAGEGGTRLLQAFAADRLPLGAQLSFGMQSMGTGLATAFLLGMVLAAPMIWLYLGSQTASGLRSEMRGATSGRGAQTLRHGLIVGQIALAFVLLAGAGVLGLSLQRVAAVSPGFRSDHVLTGQFSTAGKRYATTTARLDLMNTLFDDLKQKPGIVAAGIITNVPFSGKNPKSAAKIKGRVPLPGEAPRGHYSYGVAGDYFQAMGFTLRSGRFLDDADSHRVQRFCVVDDDFARYYWPHSSALGQLLFQGSEDGPASEAFTIAGVVRAVRQAGLTDDSAQGAIYYPYAYRSDSDVFVAVRATAAPETLGPLLQRAVRRMDPDLPVTDIHSMDTLIADSLAVRRSPVLLSALFSCVALFLTAVGTYGVLSYAVAQRRREIGIRMALGARPQEIRDQFLSVFVRLFAAGLSAGVFGIWLASHALSALLFHVAAFNLPVIAAVAGVLGLVSLVSCLVPSQRAARISPSEALNVSG